MATGGASVVVKPTITSAAQLKGQSLASPSLGNTQDVAVRYWLKQQGLTTSATGGGDVAIKPTTPNSAAVLEFKSGQIVRASEPSPYDVGDGAGRREGAAERAGHDHAVVVTQSFLAAHPAIVADLLKANSTRSAPGPTRQAREQAANAELAAYTGKPLSAKVLDPAFKEITFTDDPGAASLTQDAQQATAVGLLKAVNLSGIFDLDPLNSILTAADQPAVSAG